MNGREGLAQAARSRSLSDLARSVDWSAADVSALSGVPLSSVTEWWNDPDWLDKAPAGEVTALAVVVPGVRTYVTGLADLAAVRRAGEACDRAGLEVDWTRLNGLVSENGAASGVVPALTAAIALSTDADAAHALSRCWGRFADRACDSIFRERDAGGVFVDSSGVVAGAQRVVDGPHSGTERQVIGRGMALHRLTRNCGVEQSAPQRSSGLDLADAFTYRGAVTGRMIIGDSDVLPHYRSVLESESELQWAEVWSLATYSKDLSPAVREPTAVETGSLRGTAAQVLADLESTAPAYQEYLLECAIPLLIQADPRFGEQEARLVSAVSARLDSMPAAHTAMEAIRRYGEQTRS